jgi:SAM-dependent methyltransferase
MISREELSTLYRRWYRSLAVEECVYHRSFEIEETYWWSVGTRAIFLDWLSATLSPPPARVLDLGCGTGMLARELETIGPVYAVDISHQALLYTQKRHVIRLCAGDALSLPFASEAFDVVTATDVVEHTDDRGALAELARVLKRGGLALIHVPAFPFLWGEHDEIAHHRRRYRRGPLKRLLMEHGLIVERISHVNCFVFPVAAAVRVLKRFVRRFRTSRVPQAEIYDLPVTLNRLLMGVLSAERRLMHHTSLPFGVSLLCLARKPVRS